MKEWSEYFLKELELCEKVSDMHPSNYYAWTHRVWCVDNVLLGKTDKTKKKILSDEIESTCKFIERHISDNSPCAYLQNLMIKYKSISTHHHWLEIVKNVLDENASLIKIYSRSPGCLWNFRRLIFVLKVKELSKAQKCKHLENESNYCQLQNCEHALNYLKYLKFYISR